MTRGNYFKGLDGLRCIGMLLITLSHIEWLKLHFGYENYFGYFRQPALGNMAVTLFFTLSGFLITYRLLKEKEITGKISLSSFYKRRMARILPLYYLIVGLTFLVFANFVFYDMPGELIQWRDHKTTIGLIYLLHIPNIYYLFPKLPLVAHTWTVGVELQFYLLWPLLLTYSTKLFRAMVFCLAGFLALKGVASMIPYIYYNGEFIRDLNRFLFISRFETFMIGGIAAWSLINNKKGILRVIYTRSVQWISLLLFFGLLFSGWALQGIDQLVYAGLFALILLNVASNTNSLLKFNWRPMLYLGKISYGVYIFHPVVIFTILKFYSERAGSKHIPLLDNVLIILSCLAVSILLAALSYRYFESRFLVKRKQA